MTEFRAGDRVRIIDVGSFALRDNQRSGTVIGKRSFGYDVKIDNYGIITDGVLTFRSHELTKISDAPPSTNARLTEAEAKIAALEAEVAALRKAQEPKYEGMCLRTEIAKSPNQRRADVIKRAQAFVADLERRAGYAPPNTDGNHLFNEGCSELDFHVNAEKRTVVALAKNHIKYHGNSRVRTKAFAKCDPDDVFNADIGKAIAAGKLFGVDIPQEFVDAPKPTEVVVGMRVKGTRDWPYAAHGPFNVGDIFDVVERSDGAPNLCDTNSGIANNSVIIEDTDADYS